MLIIYKQFCCNINRKELKSLKMSPKQSSKMLQKYWNICYEKGEQVFLKYI